MSPSEQKIKSSAQNPSRRPVHVPVSDVFEIKILCLSRLEPFNFQITYFRCKYQVNLRTGIILNMSTRPEWLKKFRVFNVNKDRRNKKAVYLDRSNNLVVPTHFNLAGGTYSVPRDKESEFYREYIRFVFGDEKGKLAHTQPRPHYLAVWLS